MDVRDRIKLRLEGDREQLAFLRANAQDPSKDIEGSAIAMVKDTLRFLGLAEFVLANDVAAFKVNLKEAAEIRKNLFERFKSGEPIAASYVSILAYKDLFNALASGDMGVAKAIASLMDSSNGPEESGVHHFDYVFGSTLRSFVLGDADRSKFLMDFASLCVQLKNTDFKGYCDLFNAILTKNLESAQAAMNAIAIGHRNQSKGRGVFKGTADEALSIWGIGAGNLARYNGILVGAVPPLIPGALLIH